jgi:uncharacterized protein YbcV (DUF1398 family)
MFTLEQINKLHDRLGSQQSLREYLQALNAIGVAKFDSFLTDGHSEYYGHDGQKLTSDAEHEKLAIARQPDREGLMKHLGLHGEGKTDYFQMSKGLADSGIEKWTFDTIRMTVIYYGSDGAEMLVEPIE